MHRRLLVFVLAVVSVLALAGCHNKKVKNPIANVNSKQPDKVLFDRAMDALKHNKFEAARLTLQTLINTYPDSEFVARAKLSIGDSWYAEGGSAALVQAENEYNDFKTFFPNMPEAAEAQMKIAKIHYDQMEKADRDFTHAKRAEQAYRDMIQEFPDSQLVPKAKERLREVQEVLAQREFLIGRFYYIRQTYPAAIARLKSLTETYPLFSGSDEALYMLGQCYEDQINMIRASRYNVPEVRKGQVIKELQDGAAAAYSRILTRYPVSERAIDAKTQLQGLNRPIPQATPEAIALNKAEEESRGHDSLKSRFWQTFRKSPSVVEASRVGEPTMKDNAPESAAAYLKHISDVLNGTAGGKETRSLSADVTGSGTATAPPPNQAPPRSDNQASPNQGTPTSDPSIPELPINPDAAQVNTSQTQTAGNQAPGTTVLQSKPAEDPAKDVPPAQVNDLNTSSSNTANASSSQSNDSSNMSSSKKKKKKGFGKLNPF